MSEFMKSVDARTNLAGRNRLEMLMFRLRGRQRFGINVFKVREVIPAVDLAEMPGASHQIKGIAHLRGESVPVIDMDLAMGGAGLDAKDNLFIIVTEYNRHVQGFLVGGVERIVNLNWEDVMQPPSGAGRAHYLTAVTRVEEELVQIIDVEKVFAEVSGEEAHVSDAAKERHSKIDKESIVVLAVDDSMVARKQVERALKEVGISCHMAKDGKEALEWLEAELEKGDLITRTPVVLSDIEMPKMDGYTLTAEIKANPALSSLSVVLHSSLSGVFNEAMIKKVGADRFIAKFHPDELVDAIQSEIERVLDIEM